MPEERRYYLYGFSTSYVQKYVLASPLLRDIVGSSQQLESVCREVFRDAALRCGIDDIDDGVFSPAAGGVRLITAFGEEIKALSRIWPLVVDSLLPGVAFQQAFVSFANADEFADASRELNEKLAEAKSARIPVLPAAGPLVARCRRTGEAAVFEDHDSELIGLAIRQRRLVRDSIRLNRQNPTREQVPGKSELLDLKCMPPDMLEEGYAFAGETGDIVTDSGYTCLIHADGNDLGSIITSLIREAEHPSETPISSNMMGPFLDISREVDRATRDAVRRAVSSIREGIESGPVPVRPVVLGGDDVTLFVRADLAVGFVGELARAFEEETGEALKKFRQKKWFVEPKDFDMLHMTLAVGAVFIKEGFPFDRAYDLVESLCERAKSEARRNEQSLKGASTFCFHRVTTSLPGSVTDATREMEVPYTVASVSGTPGAGEMDSGTRMLRLGLNTYEFIPNDSDDRNTRFSFRALHDLATLLPSRYRSRLRRIAELLYSDEYMARREWERFQKVERDTSRRTDLDDFMRRVKRLVPTTSDGKLPLICHEGERLVSPLMDILALSSFLAESREAE